MKWIPVLFYLGIAAWQVWAHYDDFFPGDQAKRRTMGLCFMANHRFDPRDPGAREACLRGAEPVGMLHQASLVGVMGGHHR